MLLPLPIDCCLVPLLVNEPTVGKVSMGAMPAVSGCNYGYQNFTFSLPDSVIETLRWL